MHDALRRLCIIRASVEYSWIRLFFEHSIANKHTKVGQLSDSGKDLTRAKSPNCRSRLRFVESQERGGIYEILCRRVTGDVEPQTIISAGLA